MVRTPVRGGADAARAVRRPRRPGARAGRALHPGGRGAGQRHRGRRRPAAGARARGGATAAGGVRTDRRLHDRLRLAGAVGHPVPQHPDRQLRPAGRRAVHRAGGRHRRSQARRAGPLRPVAQPGARDPGVRRRAAGRRDARGDRDAGRGSGAGDADRRRQPGAVDAGRQAPGARRSPGWTSWPRSTSTSTRPPGTPT